MKKHQPCPCGTSSDGLYDYGDHQYCFVCLKYFKGEQEMTNMSNTPVMMKGELSSIPDRKLTQKTVELYKVLQQDGKHFYPYYKDGKLVAVKTRLPDKSGFPWSGSPGKVELFGQNLFPQGGNSVTIVEGELDALSAYQMLNEPVVSVCSASTAVSDLKNNYEWVNSFKRIVFAFDNDKAGQEAQTKCASLFDPKKVRIMKLSQHKDASDYLVNNNIKEFYEQHRTSGPFTPDGIVSGSSIYDLLLTKPEYDSVYYPWDGVNDYTYGLRTGELTLALV